MTGLESLQRLFTNKQRTPQNEAYTAFDDTYSLWKFGFTLGEFHLIHVHNSLESTIRKFRLNYKLILSKSKVLTNEIEQVNNIISKLTEINKSVESVPEKLNGEIKNIKETIADNIGFYSTHLSNVFLFGYFISKLKSSYLHKEFNQEVVNVDIENLTDIINDIVRGDKKLDSTNLEITTENLKIIRTSVNILKSKNNQLEKCCGKNYLKRRSIINECFKILLDIILDLRNPVYFANKFILYLSYYYFFAIILVVVQYALGIDDLWAPLKKIIESISITDKEWIEWIIYILIPFIYIFTFLFKQFSKKIIKIMIRIKINSIISKNLKKVH